MRQLLNTLFITTEGAYLRLEGDTLCVEVERQKKLQVPLHHLGGIVTFGDIMLTPALLRRCATDGRSVALLNRNGEFGARLEGPVSGNILLRQAQHRAAVDFSAALDIARACVAGKMRNCRLVLLRGARESKNPASIGAGFDGRIPSDHRRPTGADSYQPWSTW